ncbi:MAG: disulfide bond formation protein B [Gammaproteobacteria bacterium]|nr:MAG: disulfide bond formation protein B [Gammaproteobacteria bacterium]
MNRRQLCVVGAVACAAMMGFALFAQHVLELEPCPLCVIQRIAVISLGVIFLLAAAHDAGPAGSRLWGVLIASLATAGAVVSGRHVWLQNLPPDQVPECGPGLDYIMDVFPLMEAMSMVFAGSGECAEVVWRFLGLSMPTWVLICMVSMGVFGIVVNWRAARGSPVED